MPRRRNPDEIRWINSPYENTVPAWTPPESIESILDKSENYRKQAENTERISAKYWMQAAAEAEKLRAEMTDEQKTALDMFERHFPKSKFIDESFKLKTMKGLIK